MSRPRLGQYCENMGSANRGFLPWVFKTRRIKFLSSQFISTRDWDSLIVSIWFTKNHAIRLVLPRKNKFCLFGSFLMKCPKIYTEDPPFNLLSPLSSNIPMTTWPCLVKTKRTKPSPWECVGTQPTSTKVPARLTASELLDSVPLKPTPKDVSWSDSLFQCHHTTTTPFCRQFPLQIQATAEYQG